MLSLQYSFLLVAFFSGESTNEQQVWVTPDCAVIAVFVLALDFFLVLRLVFLRACGRSSGPRLFLMAFYSFVTCIFLISARETDDFLTLFISLFLPQVAFSKVV